jgi:lauroyl/myristoyl acyltransferase
MGFPQRYLSFPLSFLYGSFLSVLRLLTLQQAEQLAVRIVPTIMRIKKKRRLMNMRRFLGDRFSMTAFQDFEHYHLQYLSQLTIAFARLSITRGDELLRNITMVGEKHLHDASHKGNGVLLVITHTGNFWHTITVTAAKGYKVSLLVNHMPLLSVDAQIERICQCYSINLIYVGRDARQKTIEALNKNEVVVVAFDVGVRPDRCIYMPFGNAALNVDRGVAQFAVSQQIPVLLARNHHINSRESVLTIKPDRALLQQNNEASAECVLQFWMEQLTGMTLNEPSQWWPMSYVVLREAYTNPKS